MLATNILMDVPDKFPGYTHMALRVMSIPATIAALTANGIPISQGARQLRRKRASLRLPRPDRNVIELAAD